MHCDTVLTFLVCIIFNLHFITYQILRYNSYLIDILKNTSAKSSAENLNWIVLITLFCPKLHLNWIFHHTFFLFESKLKLNISVVCYQDLIDRVNIATNPLYLTMTAKSIQSSIYAILRWLERWIRFTLMNKSHQVYIW